MEQEKKRGITEIALASLLWGASFPIIKYGMMLGMDTSWLVILRFSLAALLCSFIVVYYRGLRGLSRSMFRPSFWMLGAFNGLAFVFQYHGLLYTTASKASLLINMNVIFVAFFGALLYREKLGGRIGVSITLALTGVLLLATDGDLASLTLGSMLGDFLEVMAALTWAFYILENKRLMDKGENALELTGGMLLGTFIFSSPYALFRIASGTPSTVAEASIFPLAMVIVYTALAGSLAAYFLYARGVKHVTAVVASIFLMMEVVSAVAISMVFLGEKLSIFGWMGAAAVCTGIVLAALDNSGHINPKPCRRGQKEEQMINSE